MNAARSRRAAVAALALCAWGFLGAQCQPGPPNDRPGSGSQLLLGPKVNPIALSAGGVFVYALSSAAGTLSLIDAVPPYAVQALDANGVSTTDEPTGIAFAGPNRAFVRLENRNEVPELAMGANGRFAIGARALVNAQAPRALAVAGGRLFVASAESGNQTEFPSCGAGQPQTFARGIRSTRAACSR